MIYDTIMWILLSVIPYGEIIGNYIGVWIAFTCITTFVVLFIIIISNNMDDKIFLTTSFVLLIGAYSAIDSTMVDNSFRFWYMLVSIIAVIIVILSPIIIPFAFITYCNILKERLRNG